MSADGFHYVSRGLSRVARSPVVLRAVVGPGLVVCVRTRDEAFGGMVHVASDALKDDAPADPITERVCAFLAEMEDAVGRLEGAIADIVGGADILHIYPRHLAQKVIAARVESLTGLLKCKKINIGRMRIGGSEARRVEMILPGNGLEVRSVSGPRRERIELPPSGPPEISAVLRREGPLPDVVVDMGCMAVAESPTQLVALLGSCVGIALYDRETKIGGLAHVMLPSSEGVHGEKARFADTAVPALVESLSRMGGSPRRAVAKIAGGANVLRVGNGDRTHHIGRANIESARRALDENGVDLVWQDTGGTRARKMLVNLDNFAVSIRFLGSKPGS